MSSVHNSNLSIFVTIEISIKLQNLCVNLKSDSLVAVSEEIGIFKRVIGYCHKILLLDLVISWMWFHMIEWFPCIYLISLPNYLIAPSVSRLRWVILPLFIAINYVEKITSQSSRIIKIQFISSFAACDCFLEISITALEEFRIESL